MTTAEKCIVIKYHSALICALYVITQIRELNLRSVLYHVHSLSLDDGNTRI